MALILPYDGLSPRIHDSAWLAPNATVTGDTEIGAECSLWFCTVVRGDVNWVRIGQKVNLQDGVICHVTIARAPLTIEDLVSVGHGAIVHGCTLKRGCLVGIGARVLDHAVVGEQSLVAAGSVVLEQTVIPAGELWAGVPAKKKRDLSPEERQGLLDTAERYVQYRLHYQGIQAEIPAEWLPQTKGG